MYQIPNARQISSPINSVITDAGFSIREIDVSGISSTMQDLINDLIKLDLNSAYLYLAMYNYLNRIGYTGFGNFLRAQYEEELSHAQTLMKYLNNRGGIVKIKEISAQPVNFGSLIETFSSNTST